MDARVKPGHDTAFWAGIPFFSDSLVKQPACIAVRRTASLRSPMHAHFNRLDSSPLLFGRRGVRLLFLSLTGVRERSAERRYGLHLAPCGAARRVTGTRTPGAPLWRFFTSGPCFRGGTGGSRPHVSMRLSPFSFHSRVQPLKADPRSRAGRLPEASRSGDCESQAAGATPRSANMTPHESALD